MSEIHTDWAKDAENLRREIEGYFNADLTTLDFDFIQNEDQVILHLFTISAKHKQRFLFYSVSGKTKIEALVAMLAYVREESKFENTYTIQWSVKGENALHTSYFRAADIFQALDKFSFGIDKNSMLVFSVTLNPIS